MNTARDLAIVTLDMASDHTVEQGDLSLALAAAEVFDLLDAHALVLDGDRITPSAQAPTGDRLLDEAASALVRQEPYESLEDWLWRRGRGLSTAYVEDLERVGLTARAPGPRFTLRAAPSMPVDSAARRQAEERWTSGEPVLAALGTAAADPWRVGRSRREPHRRDGHDRAGRPRQRGHGTRGRTPAAGDRGRRVRQRVAGLLGRSGTEGQRAPSSARQLFHSGVRRSVLLYSFANMT